MNPYAAPKAKLEEVLPAGAVWRDGKFVRMDRDGALPGRCVTCNAEAAARVSRTLYWSPLAWRLSTGIAPFALLFAGLLLDVPLLAAAFWPLLIVLGIVHTFVRSKLKLELGVCERHRRQRNVIRGLSIAALVAAVAVFVNLSPGDSSVLLLPLVVLAIIVLAVVQSFIGLQAVKLHRLDSQHAWLAGTGKTFREALPELRGA